MSVVVGWALSRLGVGECRRCKAPLATAWSWLSRGEDAPVGARGSRGATGVPGEALTGKRDLKTIMGIRLFTSAPLFPKLSAAGQPSPMGSHGLLGHLLWWGGSGAGGAVQGPGSYGAGGCGGMAAVSKHLSKFRRGAPLLTRAVQERSSVGGTTTGQRQVSLWVCGTRAASGEYEV